MCEPPRRGEEREGEGIRRLRGRRDVGAADGNDWGGRTERHSAGRFGGHAAGLSGLESAGVDSDDDNEQRGRWAGGTGLAEGGGGREGPEVGRRVRRRAAQRHAEQRTGATRGAGGVGALQRGGGSKSTPQWLPMSLDSSSSEPAAHDPLFGADSEATVQEQQVGWQ
jgi:hypothetical protein